MLESSLDRELRPSISETERHLRRAESWSKKANQGELKGGTSYKVAFSTFEL